MKARAQNILLLSGYFALLGACAPIKFFNAEILCAASGEKTALALDGQDDFASNDTVLISQPSSGFTLELYYKHLAHPVDQVSLASFESSDAQMRLSLNVTPAGFLSGTWANTDCELALLSCGNLAIDSLSHLALVHDGKNVRIFQNGIQSCQATATAGVCRLSKFQIGTNAAQSAFLKGVVGEILFSKGAKYLEEFTPPTPSGCPDTTVVFQWRGNTPTIQVPAAVLGLPGEPVFIPSPFF